MWWEQRWNRNSRALVPIVGGSWVPVGSLVHPLYFYLSEISIVKAFYFYFIFFKKKNRPLLKRKEAGDLGSHWIKKDLKDNEQGYVWL